jgi:hypothetical protein
MRFLFGVFPLLTIPVIIYNLMAFGFRPRPTDADPNVMTTMTDQINSVVLNVPMVAQDAIWQVTSGDILVLLSMGFFFVEVLKSTSTGSASITNHAVSMGLFIVCLIEFLLLKNFATSPFFFLTIMCLLDVLAGIVVTIMAARRDFAVGDGVGNNR